MSTTNGGETSTGIAGRKRPTARARISNGSALLPHVDGRSIWARLLRDNYAAVVSHCGGDDMVSELERQQARRIGALEAELVFMEDEFARIRASGGVPDSGRLQLYCTLVNAQRRAGEALGWQRRSRDVTPSLEAHIAATATDSSQDDAP